MATESYASEFGLDTELLSSSVTLESRDYLELFERKWVEPATRIVPMAMDITNGAPEELQSNAYFAADPQLLDDGSAFVYLSDQDSSDVTKTRAAWASSTQNGYTNEGIIDDGGYGDSSLQVTGDNTFAVAAWVRQTEEIKKDPGEEVTSSEIALVNASTEIMTATYDGNTWTTMALTDNASPDLAPVVATNGERIIVAWRSVYASNADDPMNFDAMDKIVYRVYDGSVWSEEETLYNGTSGSVMAISVAMLDDGTAAVSYTLDKGKAGNIADYEIAYAVVDTDPDYAPSETEILNGANRVIKSIQLTDDDVLDENPQLTTARIDGTEHFILGWYSQLSYLTSSGEEVTYGDIRLSAFDSQGVLMSTMPESISAITGTQEELVSANFRFVKNSGDRSLDNLSIVWSSVADTDEAEDELNEGTPTGALKAIKFAERGQQINVSAVLDVATMEDGGYIDHFDAYLSSASDQQVKAVLLASKDSDISEEVTSSISGESFYIPITQSGLYTATAAYTNEIAVSSVIPDYESLYRNGPLPVSFTLYNNGYDLINKIEVQMGGQQGYTYDELALVPGNSMIVTPVYNVPNTIENIDYKVTAYFESGEIKDVSDDIYLTENCKCKLNTSAKSFNRVRL